MLADADHGATVAHPSPPTILPYPHDLISEIRPFSDSATANYEHLGTLFTQRRGVGPPIYLTW